MPSIRARAAGAALSGLAVIATVIATPGAAADDPLYYKGKRLTVLVNFAAGGPTDIEGRLFAKHIARHIEGQPATIVQNMDGAGGLVGNSYLGEIAPKDGTMVGYFTGAAWLYATEPEQAPRRFPHLRVRRLSARHHGLLRAHRRGAGPEGGDRHRQGAGPGHRRAVGGQLEGSADPAHPRHARRSVQIRHRLSQQPECAARAAAERDQFLRRIAARLSQRGRAEPGQERAGDPALLRSGLERREHQRAQADRGTVDPAVPGAVPEDQGRASRPASCGTSISPASPSMPPCSVWWCCRPERRRPRSMRCAPRCCGSTTTRPSRRRPWARSAIVPNYEAGPQTNRQVRTALTVSPEIRSFVLDYIKNAKK